MNRIKGTFIFLLAAFLGAALAVHSQNAETPPEASAESAPKETKAPVKKAKKPAKKKKKPAPKPVSEYKFDQIDSIPTYKFDDQTDPIIKTKAKAKTKARTKSKSKNKPKKETPKKPEYKFDQIDSIPAYKFDKQTNPIIKAKPKKKPSKKAGGKKTSASKPAEEPKEQPPTDEGGEIKQGELPQAPPQQPAGD